MAATNAGVAAADSAASSDEAAAKTAQKRYEGLLMVRNKAIKGKGAWYWTHLEPLLVHNTESKVSLREMSLLSEICRL